VEEKRPGWIKRFFLFWWNLLDTFRRFIFNLIFLFVLIIIVIGLFSEEAPSVPAASALVVNPSGVLVDQISYADPFSNLIAGNDAPPETLLADLVKAIDVAATDDRIKIMVLETDAIEHGGISKSEELSAAIKRFRDHIHRFNKLYEMIQRREIDETWLAEVESRDTIFKELDYRVYT